MYVVSIDEKEVIKAIQTSSSLDKCEYSLLLHPMEIKMSNQFSTKKLKTLTTSCRENWAP